MTDRGPCAARGLAFFVCLWLSGCPSDGRDPPREPLTTPEAVLERARAFLATGPAHAILEARASQYSDAGGIKGKVEILLARPGRVRFTGLSPTDDLVSVLATDGQRFTAFERGQKSCWVGRACAANVGRFTGFALEPDELLGVLIGRPPLIAYDQATLGWDRAVGGYRVDLVGTSAALGGDKGKVVRLFVGHEDGRILGLQVRAGAKVEVDVRYDDWRRVGEHGDLMPGRVDVRMARGSTDLRIVYRDIDVATPIEDAAFVFECPTGTTLEEQPCY